MKEDFLRDSIILNSKREIATKFSTKSIIYNFTGNSNNNVEFHFDR